VSCRYEELHQYDEAIRVAYSRNHPNAAEIASGYFQMLVKSGQEEKAGMLKEQAGEVDAAIDLYLKVRARVALDVSDCATLTRSQHGFFGLVFDRLIVQGGLPGKAASLASHPQYQQTPEKLEMIAVALAKAGLSEKAGEFYDKLNMSQKAMTVYRQSASLSVQACQKRRPCIRSVWRAYAIAKSSRIGRLSCSGTDGPRSVWATASGTPSTWLGACTPRQWCSSKRTGAIGSCPRRRCSCCRCINRTLKPSPARPHNGPRLLRLCDGLCG
jgi:hypothetical protein